MNWFWLQCMFLDFLSLEESFFDALLLLYLFCVTQFNVKFKNVGLTFNIFFFASYEVGCQIPADMRVVEMLGSQLRVDQAILTG